MRKKIIKKIIFTWSPNYKTVVQIHYEDAAKTKDKACVHNEGREVQGDAYILTVEVQCKQR